MTLAVIESQIELLSLPDQLALMESLAKKIRVRTQNDLPQHEWNFAEMASDPDIRREIQQIEREFACTELDGLSSEP